MADRWCALNQARISERKRRSGAGSQNLAWSAPLKRESSEVMGPACVTMVLAHEAANACTEPWYSRAALDLQRGKVSPADRAVSRSSPPSNSGHCRAHRG